MIRFEVARKPADFVEKVEAPGADWLEKNPTGRPPDLWGAFKPSGWLNSSKGNLASKQIPDPFEVGDGWFEILLPSLQLIITDAVPEVERPRAMFALTRLHLRDDERVIRQRREWYCMYQDGEITLDGLRKKAPLIARAVERRRA